MEVVRNQKTTEYLSEQSAFATKRNFFDAGHTRTSAFRQKQLKLLLAGIRKYESEILQALKSDLGKSEVEAYANEIGMIYTEINHAQKSLKTWMRKKKVATPLVLQPSSSHIIYEPLGVVLIISPWNYPFQLSMAPVIGAIAAGNCIVLKPSEEAAATAKIIEILISDTFSKEYISVVNGLGHEVVPALMERYDFNHIFFTGSPAVGSLIAQAAAKKLTPVTLELGGKSPAIVDASANIRVAAQRLTWSKFTNAGQSCVAPDYLLVHTSVKKELLREIETAITRFYGSEPKTSPDYGRMINEKRFDAVTAFLGDGRICLGGQSDKTDRYIAPTVMDEIRSDSPVMKEEIFGPVWPILTWESTDDILRITRENRYPLACYYFGTDKKLEKEILEKVEFGGGCVNNALVHLGNPDLPFGGVQGSGSGRYHGWYSFECFSHTKGILKTATWIDPFVKYPPYTSFKLKILKKFFG